MNWSRKPISVSLGMDIELKVDLVERMQLIQVLLRVPNNPGSEDCAEELANLVDTLFLALIGFWQKTEETSVFPSISSGAAVQANEASLVGRVASMMNALFPLLLRLFHSSETSVSCAVMPSLNRYTSLLRQQLRGQQVLEAVQQQKMFHDYFIADSFTTDVLRAVYRQMQFPDDFGFNPNDDDDAEEIEVSFSNFCCGACDWERQR